MSTIPTHLPVPSHHLWRYRFPGANYFDQWRPVYHASGITKKHHLAVALAHKRRSHAAVRALEVEQTAACAAAAQLQPSASPQSRLATALRLAAAGRPSEAGAIFAALHQARILRPLDYVRYIEGLSAPLVYTTLMQSKALFDDARALKHMEDHSASTRVAEAVSAMEAAATVGPLTAQHYNAFMRTLLTGGYDGVRRIADEVYDAMGAAKVLPTAETYGLVMHALALQADPHSAEHVLRFLRTHAADELRAEHFRSLMMGFRLAKIHDRCDALWGELVDRRWPRPTMAVAEEQLRNVIDLANTPLSDAHLQLHGQTNVVEKKRIPIILRDMRACGLERSALCPPLLHEVNMAMRAFQIPKSRFYEWGRAAKLFDFIDFRRKNGWTVDLPDVNIAQSSAPMLRPPGADATDGIAPFATAELPSVFAERQPWEVPPLEGLLNITAPVEQMDDPRGGSEKMQMTVKPVHERSTAWRSEVPQTRYDPLYGISQPNIPKLGIRRHLQAGEAAALGTDQDERAHDANILRGALSSARRVRRSVERFKTHRGGSDEK